MQYCRKSEISDPTLRGIDPKSVNLLFASWAADLFSGQNCNSLDIRSTTVNNYLKAAQKLIVKGGYSHPDGLPLDDNNNSESQLFISKVKKYESLPNRRSIIDDEMIEEHYQRKLSSLQDSLEDCFFDWLILGRYTGFRLSEWAQTRKHTYELIEGTTDARAMIDDDWSYYDHTGRLIDKLQSNEHLIYKVDICWRFQKNKQNGEIISFWRDDIDPRFCPVRAAWRITMRARRLGIDKSQPLGQYFDHKHGRVAYMNSVEVERLLRDVAKFTTNIQDDTLIKQMFGMHCIRVTACNELARLGVKDSFLQKRLRWRSLTFLDYLRNNMYTAIRHNLSLNIKFSPHDTSLRHNLLQPHTSGLTQTGIMC